MYFQDQGIVFSKKDFKESDLLVTVYTKKYGKVFLQARGGKKITSKLSSHIEPANLVIINVWFQNVGLSGFEPCYQGKWYRW
jgi:DNA repair protein RecO